jgi:hypothetical protein
MKKLSDENFTYPAGTSVVSKQCGASDLPEPYAAQRDITGLFTAHFLR